MVDVVDGSILEDSLKECNAFLGISISDSLQGLAILIFNLVLFLFHSNLNVNLAVWVVSTK